MNMIKQSDTFTSFHGAVQPITDLAELSKFKFKIVMEDGREYTLAAARHQQKQFKMDLWEKFHIKGLLLSNGVIVVKDAGVKLSELFF